MPLTQKQSQIEPVLIVILNPEKFNPNFKLEDQINKLNAHDCHQLLDILKIEIKILSLHFHRTSLDLIHQDYSLEQLRNFQDFNYKEAKEKINRFQSSLKDEFEAKTSILNGLCDVIHTRTQSLKTHKSNLSCWASCFNFWANDNEITDLYDTLKAKVINTIKFA